MKSGEIRNQPPSNIEIPDATRFSIVQAIRQG
jgi:hypothetical protein